MENFPGYYRPVLIIKIFLRNVITTETTYKTVKVFPSIKKSDVMISTDACQYGSIDIIIAVTKNANTESLTNSTVKNCISIVT